jgi:uncharacterized protein with FMN-binding domain
VQLADAGRTAEPQPAQPETATLPTMPPLPRPRPEDAPTQASSASTGGDGGSTVLVAQAGYKNGTFRGPSENAYYGRVQVAAVIQNGQLAKVEILDYPSDRRRSANISNYSLPILQQEAIQAQNARVDLVSGATLTSEAFERSLGAALASAHG